MEQTGSTLQPNGFEDMRCALVGQSLATPVVTMLLGSLLAPRNILSRLPSVKECWGPASDETEAELKRRLQLEGVPIDYEIIARLHRSASW